MPCSATKLPQFQPIQVHDLSCIGWQIAAPSLQSRQKGSRLAEQQTWWRRNMTSSAARSTLTKRIAATAAVLGLATVALAATPKPANAWWYHHGYCCGWGVGVVIPP